MWTALFIFCVLVLIYLMVCFVNRRETPLNLLPKYDSELAQGLDPVTCETCGRSGVLLLHAPWRNNLSLNEQMTSGNQTDCDCCHGAGFHWIPYGGKFRCIYYAKPESKEVSNKQW